MDGSCPVWHGPWITIIAAQAEGLLPATSVFTKEVAVTCKSIYPPVVAPIAGRAILVAPKRLNFIVAIYLIVFGVLAQLRQLWGYFSPNLLKSHNAS